MDAERSDVLVIGGGPAGSTAAALLAKKGYRVVVLERETFPRDHVGESLLPYCYPIFQELGVLEEMRRRFVRKPGVRFVDVDGTTHTTWCFSHVIQGPSHLSFHVVRSEFDQLLLENAAQHGAEVREGVRATGVNLDVDGGVEVRASGRGGSEQRYRARFLIDASGRDTFLATRMRSKTPHPRLERAALSTHWRGAQYSGGIEEGLLQIVYLGGEKKGWIWAIPVGVDRVSVGVVFDHGYLREERARLSADGDGDWRTRLYRRELFSSPYVAGLLADAEPIQPIMVNGDYSYSVSGKFGPTHALVGDASAFIDPIFASGVYLSMNSSRLVADALDRRLSSGDGGDGMRAAYDQIEGAYALVDKAIQRFYEPVAINFAQAGSAAGLLHQFHENAMAVGHFLLAGDFFEHHERYAAFLDLLADPQLLRLYRSSVIERPAYMTSSCHVSRQDIFAPALAGERGRQG